MMDNVLVEYYDIVKAKGPLVVDDSLMIKSYPDIKKRIEEMLHFNLFDEAIESLSLIIETIMVPLEKAKSKEVKALALFAKDYYSADNLTTISFNDEVKECFDDAIYYYRRSKEEKLLFEANYRVATYYSYFRSKLDSFIGTAKRIYSAVYSQSMTAESKIGFFFQCQRLFEEIGMKRKSTLFYYLAFMLCLSNSRFERMVPILFDQLRSELNIYNVSEYTIDSYEKFLAVHRKVIKNQFKPYECFMLSGDTDEKRTEIAKKRIEKGQRIAVINRHNELKEIELLSKWDAIQREMYSQMISYHKKSFEAKEVLSMSLSCIQTLHRSMSKEELQRIAAECGHNPINLQDKLLLHLPLMPVLVRILPIQSNITFDITQNQPNPKNKSIFLYNPWDRNKTVNYFWTNNSFQAVSIKFYNPMSIALAVSNLIVLFDTGEGEPKSIDHPFSFPSSPFTIPPNSTGEIINKVLIKAMPSIMIAIRGVQYDVFNSISRQYVDSNGNGLFYCSQYMIVKHKKRKQHSLRQIFIHPSIPLIAVRLLNDSINNSIELFDSQYHTFSLRIENIGEYDVNRLTVNVYAFKQEDYKVEIEEVKIGEVIQKGCSFVFNYLYLHKSSTIQIEFLINYSSKEKDREAVSEVIAINPQVVYVKPVNSIRMLSFSNLRIIHKTLSHTIDRIIREDSRLCDLNYFARYMTNDYIIFFTLENKLNCSLKLFLLNGEEVMRDYFIEGRSTQTLSFEINALTQLSEISIEWSAVTKRAFKGLIKLTEVFSCAPLALSHLSSEITVTPNGKGNCCLIQCDFINQSTEAIRNAKVYLYIYQDYNGFLLFNDQLKEKMFYEGSLEYHMKCIHPQEKASFELIVYPFSPELFKTTMLVIDKDKKELYMSPNSRQFSYAPCL